MTAIANNTSQKIDHPNAIALLLALNVGAIIKHNNESKYSK
jgi:hypothetical protein